MKNYTNGALDISSIPGVNDVNDVLASLNGLINLHDVCHTKGIYMILE